MYEPTLHIHGHKLKLIVYRFKQLTVLCQSSMQGYILGFTYWALLGRLLLILWMDDDPSSVVDESSGSTKSVPRSRRTSKASSLIVHCCLKVDSWRVMTEAFISKRHNGVVSSIAWDFAKTKSLSVTWFVSRWLSHKDLQSTVNMRDCLYLKYRNIRINLWLS